MKAMEITYDEACGYRRTTKRMPCSLTGRFLAQDKTLSAVTCQDISTEGAGVTTAVHLPINTYVTIGMDTKKKNCLLLEGRVCWCKRILSGWHAGIKFDRPLPFEMSTFA